jgi:heptosyltransferase I
MRLLVFRLSALGDVIHTIPAVVALRDSSEITWVVESAYAELVEIAAGVRTVPVRMKRWGRGLLASRNEMAEARRGMRGFDASVDFQGLWKSALLGSIAAAPLRFGFDRNAMREKGAALFYNRNVAIDQTRHVVEWNLQLAQAVAPLSDESPAWTAFSSDRNGALIPYMNRIVLLPGAGRPEKQWSVERFREVVARFGDQTLVVWGPGEEALANAIGGEVAPATNLRELSYILENASVVIGGDTGPLHLAAALEAPVVGLYGPTDPRRNGPYGQLASCISHFDTTGSMASIPAKEVIARVEEVMA